MAEYMACPAAWLWAFAQEYGQAALWLFLPALAGQSLMRR
jgi:hypothetical protein